MTVTPELKRKYPHSVAVLRFPDIPSPRWFHSRGPNMDAVVSENGVVVHGDNLELVDGTLPAVGTAVKLLFSKSFLFVEDKDEYDAREKAAFAAAEEKRRNEHRAKLVDAQARAEAANAKLNIPVRWTSGEKPVLSGLSRNSWGDGRNRRSVNHVLLLEPISEGRFTREAESFLCTSGSGTNGKQWTDDPTTYSVGHEGKYVSCINCTQCLKLAARWRPFKQDRAGIGRA
jgi:hypothetical protein